MRTFLVVFLALCTMSAGAGSLSKLDHVDLIELEANTSRPVLVVLLEQDRVNTRQAVKSLFKKVNNYLDFARSGQLKEAAPNSSTTLRPKIIVYGPEGATSGEMQNLDGLKLAGQKAGVEVEVLPYRAGIKPRPVAIKPVQRGGA
jgi:hypothetical protein